VLDSRPALLASRGSAFSLASRPGDAGDDVSCRTR